MHVVAFLGDGERRSEADGVARLRFSDLNTVCRVGVEGCGLNARVRAMALRHLDGDFRWCFEGLNASSSARTWLEGGVNKPGLKRLPLRVGESAGGDGSCCLADLAGDFAAFLRVGLRVLRFIACWPVSLPSAKAGPCSEIGRAHV